MLFNEQEYSEKLIKKNVSWLAKKKENIFVYQITFFVLIEKIRLFMYYGVPFDIYIMMKSIALLILSRRLHLFATRYEK